MPHDRDRFPSFPCSIFADSCSVVLTMVYGMLNRLSIRRQLQLKSFRACFYVMDVSAPSPEEGTRATSCLLLLIIFGLVYHDILLRFPWARIWTATNLIASCQPVHGNAESTNWSMTCRRRPWEKLTDMGSDSDSPWLDHTDLRRPFGQIWGLFPFYDVLPKAVSRSIDACALTNPGRPALDLYTAPRMALAPSFFRYASESSRTMSSRPDDVHGLVCGDIHHGRQKLGDTVFAIE